MLFMLYLLTVFSISYDDILIFGISTLYSLIILYRIFIISFII